MANRIFTANTIITESPGSEPILFSIGDEVPEWAYEKVGSHITEGNTRAASAPAADEVGDDDTDAGDTGADADSDADEEAGEYDDLNKDELKRDAKARGIEGYSKMNKEELIAALEADDEEE